MGTISPHDRSLRDVLDRADQALYLAKNRGRNQIAIAPVDGSPHVRTRPRQVGPMASNPWHFSAWTQPRTR